MNRATRVSATLKRGLGALAAAAFLTGAIVTAAAPASADPRNQEQQDAQRDSVPGVTLSRCLPRELVAERLGKRFGEVRTAGGLASNGALMEVYSSPDGATWTVVMTMPQGISCIVAAGESWRSHKQVAYGPDA